MRRLLAASAVGCWLAAGSSLVAQVSAPPAFVADQDRHLAEFVVESLHGADVKPIPLVVGAQTIGAVYDRYMLALVAARQASAAGKSVTADQVQASPTWQSRRFVIVAFPKNCDGKPDRPLAIKFTPGLSLPMTPPAQPSLRGDAAESWLPGVDLAPDALVQPMGSMPFINAHVDIDYAEPFCHGATTTASVLLAQIPSMAGRGVNALKLPESSTLPSPTTVRISALIDLDGKARYLAPVQGPDELGPTAMAALAAGRYTPTMVNGVPIVEAALIPVVFTTTGAPGQIAAFVPPPGVISTTTRVAVPAGIIGPSSGPAPSASSTGRGSHDTVTADVPGLTPATSKCTVAADDSYGVAPAAPVKVGGDFAAGPAREQRYMSALRGPAGQGLHFVRLGSVMGPDKTILDMYEVSYAGLTQAIRIYVDEYRTETLQAPRGFTCAAPLDIK